MSHANAEAVPRRRATVWTQIQWNTACPALAVMCGHIFSSKAVPSETYAYAFLKIANQLLKLRNSESSFCNFIRGYQKAAFT